jgi:hypothetical protein
MQILESTALMDWVWQPEDAAPVPLSVISLYQLEKETGIFLTDIFRQPPADDEVEGENATTASGITAASTATEVATEFMKEEEEEDNSLLQDQIVLSVTLQVRQQLERNGRQVLETIVTCQYLSESSIPTDLPAVLLQVINRNQGPTDTQLSNDSSSAAEALQSMLAAAIGVTEASTLSFSIRSLDESKILETVFQIDEPDEPLGDDDDDDGRSKADGGLVAAVIILSLMVVLVSGVLLYITGGWSECRRGISNCLFEEVDDDYDAPRQKNTFPYEHEHDDPDEEEYSEGGSEDDDSIETGIATNPTGILGAHSHDENADPMAGLGIKTPSRNMYGGDNNGVDMTPMSAMTNNDTDAPLPLGITSMRKLPQPETPEVQGGLAHMIMARVAKATTYTPSK